MLFSSDSSRIIFALSLGALLSACISKRHFVHGVLDPSLSKVREQPRSPGDNGTYLSAQEASSILAGLCQGRKPRSKVEHQVQYIIPPPEKGLPTDQVAEALNEARAKMRILMWGFYSSIYTASGADWLLARNQNPPVFVLKEEGAAGAKQDPKAIDILANKLSNSGYYRGNGLIPNRELPEAPSQRRNFVVVYRPMTVPKWQATLVNSARFFETNRDVNGKVEDRFPPKGYRDVGMLEFEALRGHYLLAVGEDEYELWTSTAVQKAVQKVPSRLRQVDTSKPPLPPTILLKDQAEVFAGFLAFNTSVLESATEDPYLFAFTVRLNTEPLCRLARPIADFKS